MLIFVSTGSELGNAHSLSWRESESLARVRTLKQKRSSLRLHRGPWGAPSKENLFNQSLGLNPLHVNNCDKQGMRRDTQSSRQPCHSEGRQAPRACPVLAEALSEVEGEVERNLLSLVASTAPPFYFWSIAIKRLFKDSASVGCAKIPSRSAV